MPAYFYICCLFFHYLLLSLAVPLPMCFPKLSTIAFTKYHVLSCTAYIKGTVSPVENRLKLISMDRPIQHPGSHLNYSNFPLLSWIWVANANAHSKYSIPHSWCKASRTIFFTKALNDWASSRCRLLKLCTFRNINCLFYERHYDLLSAFFRMAYSRYWGIERVRTCESASRNLKRLLKCLNSWRLMS
jgi:hypothetical protein